MDWIKDLLKPELIWFLVGLVLLLLEFALPGLIIGFFGVGAWIVAVICLVTNISINAQLIIFIITSVLSLVILRKWAKGIFMGHSAGKQNLNEDFKDFIGERAVVIEKISVKSGGKVELHGTNWIAVADQEIEQGVTVEIIGKENITLKVKAI